MVGSWGYGSRLVADRGWCYSAMQRRFGVGAWMVAGKGTCEREADGKWSACKWRLGCWEHVGWAC